MLYRPHRSLSSKHLGSDYYDIKSLSLPFPCIDHLSLGLHNKLLNELMQIVHDAKFCVDSVLFYLGLSLFNRFAYFQLRMADIPKLLEEYKSLLPV